MSTPPALPPAPAGFLLVDSHCHLNFPDYATDIDSVISRSREAGVSVMQTICTEMNEFDEVRAIAEHYAGVYCSVGVHPNEVANDKIVSLQYLIDSTSYPEVIGIGETGLDYHYESSPRALQHESFLIHIACARETGLPLIVHTRDADEDTVRILREEMKKGPFSGVIHCFSSSKYLADETIELGFYISISGIATFKKADALRAIIRELPLERLLVETDAPYLAPDPFRGKRNEPSFTRYTNRLVAELKNISEGECAAATSENFFRLFSKAARPDL